VNLFDVNTSDPPNLAVPDNLFNWRSHPWAKKIQWPFQHLSALFWTFDYVLQETSARWIFRSDDDILINFEILLPFMVEMERKYNPLTDIVIHGDCIHNVLFYPQGGGGVLMSRRAVQKIVPFGNFSIWELDDDCPDKRLGRIMKKLKIPIKLCSSSAFLGQPLAHGDAVRLIDRNFAEFPPCPPMKCVNISCNSIVRPGGQLVFFHAGFLKVAPHEEFWFRVRMARNLFNAPNELAVMQVGGYAKVLCWRYDVLSEEGRPDFVLL
jgi:hypothetical protein